MVWFKYWKAEIISAILIILAITVFSIIFYKDYKNSTIKTGIVVGKSYSPSNTSTGVGVGADGTLVTTVNSNSEKYILFIDGKNLNGKDKIAPVKVSVEEYISYKEGDKYPKEE